MSQVYESDFMLILCNQLTECPSIKALDEKFSLSLFSILSPTTIVAIDNEVSANPFLASEAIALLELASQLSSYYNYDFVMNMYTTAIAARTRWIKTANGAYASKSSTLQNELMQEYFVSDAADLQSFLDNNPLYLGVYLYVYLRSVSML